MYDRGAALSRGDDVDVDIDVVSLVNQVAHATLDFLTSLLVQFQGQRDVTHQRV